MESYLNYFLGGLVLLEYLVDVLADEEADSDFRGLSTVGEAVLALNFSDATHTSGGLCLID